jgi:hypothetical protein
MEREQAGEQVPVLGLARGRAQVPVLGLARGPAQVPVLGLV